MVSRLRSAALRLSPLREAAPHADRAHERSLARRLLLTAAFALLFALSFEFRAGDLRFDAGMVAGWLALAPLWLLIRGQSPGVAFRRAFLAAWVGYACVFWWLFVVITVYGRAAPYAGVVGTIAVAAYCALCAATAASLAAALAPHAGRAAFFVLPAAWILAERVRALESVAAFPWAFLGYAAHADPPLRGLASLTGVYGLSFGLGLGAVLLAERRFAAALGLAAALHLAGWLALPGSLPPGRERPLRASMIQGNIPQNEKWNPVLEANNFAIQLEQSRAALSEKPDLITWPEAGFPGFILLPQQDARYPGLADAEREFRDPLLRLSRESGVPILVGALGITDRPGRSMPSIHNSVFAITPEQGIADRYDKTVLVPFGEYVPARALFGQLKAVASGLADVGDLTPGTAPRRIRGLERFGAERAAAVLICYEVVYPSVVRKAVRDGARLLVNLTNDAWYGRSSAPHQFLAIAQLRSAEHGLPMLRDANTGVTAVIDASGAVLDETPIFERRVLTVDAPPPRAHATLYTRVGDWPLALSSVFLAACASAAWLRRASR
jgi:apolipoprotein N-acyltransferase